MKTKMRLIVTIASGLVFSVLVAACVPARAAPATQGDVPVTQASQIVGVWRTYNPDCRTEFLLVHADDTWTTSCNRDGSHGSSGKYSLEGGRFAVTDDYCTNGGQYQVYAPEPGASGKTLTFKTIKDDCASRVQLLTTQPVTWDSALP